MYFFIQDLIFKDSLSPVILSGWAGTGRIIGVSVLYLSSLITIEQEAAAN